MRAAPREFQRETATEYAEPTARTDAGADPSEIHVLAGDRFDPANSFSAEPDGWPAPDLGRLDAVGSIITNQIERLHELADRFGSSPTLRSLSIAGALLITFGFGWACATIFDSPPDATLSPPVQKVERSPGRLESERNPRHSHRIANAAAPRNPAPAESNKVKASASAASARLITSAAAQLEAEPQTTSSIGPASSESNPPPPLSPVPETRPTTIAGWSVRDVDGDRVVLVGPDHVWTVRTGDNVPGVGRIDTIVRWGSRWIVATSAGLISTQ